jgi:hypothetical protein
MLSDFKNRIFKPLFLNGKQAADQQNIAGAAAILIVTIYTALAKKAEKMGF